MHISATLDEGDFVLYRTGQWWIDGVSVGASPGSSRKKRQADQHETTELFVFCFAEMTPNTRESSTTFASFFLPLLCLNLGVSMALL